MRELYEEDVSKVYTKFCFAVALLFLRTSSIVRYRYMYIVK